LLWNFTEVYVVPGITAWFFTWWFNMSIDSTSSSSHKTMKEESNVVNLHTTITTYLYWNEHQFQCM
jgi:uncharacterized membrane protein